MDYKKKYFTNTTVKSTVIHQIYLDFIEQQNIFLQNKKIMDVGCATGEFLSCLSKENKISGIDISKYAIDQCRKTLPYGTFSILDINENRISSKVKYDIITMFDVLEHLYNIENLAHLLENNLKKNGYFILTTPNANSLQRFTSLKAFSGEVDPTHWILYTPYTLDFLMRKLNLKRILLSTPYGFYFKSNFITKNVLFGGQIFAIYKKL